MARYNAPGFFGAQTAFTMRKAAPTGTLTLSPFGAPQVGQSPYFIATGDFNNDGKPDFATANSNSNNVSVWLGTGQGALAQAPGSPFAVGSGPVRLVVADFNGDGRQDIATANYFGNNISVLLGNGQGGFSSAFGSPFGGASPGTFGIVAMDMNRDGITDLVVSNTGTNSLAIFHGNGRGGFTPSPYPETPVGADPEFMTTGDFDGDGKPDLAVANYQGGTVTVLLGNGLNGFVSAGAAIPVGFGPYGIAAGDLNGDGRQDLAVANDGSNSVMVLLGNGTGGFSAAPGSPFVTGPRPVSVVIGDFNGDGKPDLAMAHFAGNTVRVFLGNGGGGFSAGGTFPLGSSLPIALAAADFDRDGRTDLVSANFGSNEVTVLLGYPASTGSVLSSTVATTVPYGTAVPLTLAVGVNGTSFASPATGSVTFRDGASVLGTSTLTGGATSFSASGLSVGSHALTAAYGGTGTFSPSTSNTLNITVSAAAATVTLGGLAATYTGNPVAVTVTTNPPSLSTAVTYNGSPVAPNAPGSYAVVATVTDPGYTGSASGTLVISGVTITLQTNVAGIPIVVDGGAPQVSPWTGILAPGLHSISVPLTASGSAGTRYVFSTWSDGGQAAHAITVGAAPSTYTATFGTEYLLTTSAGVGGTIGSGGYFAAGSSATVMATPSPGFNFVGFTGAVTTNGNPVSVVMDGPKALQAGFVFAGTPLLTAAVVSRADGTSPNQRVWTVQVTNAGSGAALNPRITGIQILAANPAGNLGLI